MASAKPVITHEVQEGVTCAEAGGPLESFFGCAKQRADPGHHGKFIAACDFTENSFPLPTEAEHLRQDIFEYVKIRMMLTVRIHVNIVSPDRPLMRENGNKYIFGDDRGKKKSTCGSGYVYFMVENQFEIKNNEETENFPIFPDFPILPKF